MGQMLGILDRLRASFARAVLPPGMDVGWRVGGPGGTMAYDAARVSRRNVDFVPPNLGPNATAERYGGLNLIRARARFFADNNELVDAAAWTVVDAIVGAGLDGLEPDTGNPDVDEQLRKRLAIRLAKVDPERKFSLGEHQQLFQREVAVCGEVGVLRTIAPAFKGFPKAPAMELIDADRIPVDLAGKLESGNVVRQGVEYDTLGRVVAYHVLKHNPRDEDWMSGGIAYASFASESMVRIGVEFMDLCFMSRRVAQLRGVPSWVSVMRTLDTHDGYYDKTMLLAELISTMGISMESDNADLFRRKDGKVGEYGAVDSTGQPVSVLRGLQIFFRKKGSAAPQAIAPTVNGQSFDPVNREGNARASRAFGLRYDEFSGRYGETNFAGGRLGAVDSHRGVERRREWLLERHTFPFVRMCTDFDLLRGDLVIADAVVEDLGPDLYTLGVGLKGPPAVNPYQEAQAEKTEIESGTLSRITACSAKGRSARREIENEAKFEKWENEIRAKHGLGPKVKPAAADGKPPTPGSPEDPNHNPDDPPKPGDQNALNGVDAHA